MKIATGFFFLSGFVQIYRFINLQLSDEDEYVDRYDTNAPFLLLIGDHTNYSTKKALEIAHTPIDEATLAQTIRDEMQNLSEQDFDAHLYLL